jgi:hypothetical protein
MNGDNVEWIWAKVSGEEGSLRRALMESSSFL